MSHWNEALVNLVRREFDRMWSERRRSGRTGIVTSYDPKTHTAKVLLQPEGKLSGWLPILCHHAGDNCGILIGLTPGSGGQSTGTGTDSGSSSGGSDSGQMATGDMVEVSYQEGDLESGRITGRIHNEQDTPPEVQSGEMLFQHKNGNNTFFKADGSVTTLHAASGNYTSLDKNGNITGFIKDPSKTQHYVGGDPTAGGTFGPIMTAKGPSKYAKARIS